MMAGVNIRLPVMVWNVIEDQATQTPPMNMASRRASRLGMT